MKKFGKLLLLVLVGGFFFTCALGSSTDSSFKDKDGNEKKTYKLNEDIYVKNSSGEYRVKFTSVKETKSRNQFSDKKADRVVIVSYEYENISCEDDLMIDDILNFKLYDKDNNKLETYPASTKYASDVSKGRKTDASEAYALNNSENYIELEFYDNVWNSKPDAKVILEW